MISIDMRDIPFYIVFRSEHLQLFICIILCLNDFPFLHKNDTDIVFVLFGEHDASQYLGK